MAIAGSDVSIVSTSSNIGREENVPFQRIMQPSSVPSVSHPAQTFATAAWKPKDPPCFFGRSTEDADTWVSLVRNYLTFMLGSDLQQVAYTATLFREAAHE